MGYKPGTYSRTYFLAVLDGFRGLVSVSNGLSISLVIWRFCGYSWG